MYKHSPPPQRTCSCNNNSNLKLHSRWNMSAVQCTRENKKTKVQMRNAIGGAGEEEWREATAGIRRRSVFLRTVNATALSLLVTDNIDQTRQMWLQKWHEGVPDHSRHEVEGSLEQKSVKKDPRKKDPIFTTAARAVGWWRYMVTATRVVSLLWYDSVCRASSSIKSKINNHSLPFMESPTGGERRANHEEKKMCHCKFIKNSWFSTRCAHLPLTNWHLCSRCA